MESELAVVFKRFHQIFMLLIVLGGACFVEAQEPMIGGQNGVTWRSLVIGTAAETLSRKTFYVDGMDNMSAFWSRHTDLKTDSVNFSLAFIGLSVAQIRDGLDSLYADEKNLQVPIVDGVLLVRLLNSRIEQSRIDDILEEFRKATINGPDPERESYIWKKALELIK